MPSAYLLFTLRFSCPEVREHFAVWLGGSVLLDRGVGIGSTLITNSENLFQKNENIWHLWEFQSVFEGVRSYCHGLEAPPIPQLW